MEEEEEEHKLRMQSPSESDSWRVRPGSSQRSIFNGSLWAVSSGVSSTSKFPGQSTLLNVTHGRPTRHVRKQERV